MLLSAFVSAANSADPRASAIQVLRERNHTGQVIYLHQDRQRNQFISIDNNGNLFVWDALSYRQISTARRIPFSVAKVAHLSGRDHMVFAVDGGVALLEQDSNTPPQLIGRLQGALMGISEALPGERVRAVVYHDKTLKVIEIDRTGTMRALHQLQGIDPSSIGLSADGRLLAIATTKSELSLLDLDSGQFKWQRATEAPLTFIRIGDRGVLIGAYDNLIGYQLKRIDQFDSATGATTRSIKVPCSVLQIDIVDDDRGFAICGASALDKLKFSAGPVHEQFLTWSLASMAAPSSVPAPGSSLLPFPTGVMLLKTDRTFIVGNSNGELLAARLTDQGFAQSMTRLAPLPTKVARITINTEGSTLLAFSPFWSTGAAEGQESEAIRKSRVAALASVNGGEGPHLEAAEPTAINRFFRPNRMMLWNMTNPMLTASKTSPLGFVEDASLGNGQISVVEQVISPIEMQGDVPLFAVSRVSDEDGMLSHTRPISFDLDEGLLTEGKISPSDSQRAFSVTCLGISPAGIARLSGDGSMMMAICAVIEPEALDTLKTRPKEPTYAVLTLPLGAASSSTPRRIFIPGTAQQFELSPDGKTAAVYVNTRIGDPLVESDHGDHALLILDTDSGSVVASFTNLAPPAPGRGLVFVPQGNSLYVAVGSSVYRYRLDDKDFAPVPLAPRLEGTSISSLGVDSSATRLAVSTRRGRTYIYALADARQFATLDHPGELINQVEFFGHDSTRLVASSDTSGVSLFDYATGERLADYLSYTSGAWSVSAPSGVFTASVGGEQGITISSGDRAAAIDQLYDLFFRPDLLAKRITLGEPAQVLTDNVREALGTPPPTVEIEIDAKPRDPVATIKVRNTGGGIGGLRLFHNGKLARSMTASEMLSGQSNPSNDTFTLSVPLPVAAGANEYLVSALNGPGTMQGRFASARLDDAEVSRARRAFLITLGVNHFEKDAFPTLQLAELSATKVSAEFHKVLASAVGDTQLDSIMLIGTSGTRASLESALERIETEARPDDIVAIVMTTHGKILASGELLVATWDTRPDGERGLTASRLLDAMRRSQALTQILVLDICHAGAVPERLASIYQERFAVFAGQAGIHVLAATSQSETALADYGSTTPFAHFLLLRLAEPPQTTGVPRSLRKIAEAAAQDTRQMAKKFHFNQIPSVYSFGRDFRFP